MTEVLAYGTAVIVESEQAPGRGDLNQAAGALAQ